TCGVSAACLMFDPTVTNKSEINRDRGTHLSESQRADFFRTPKKVGNSRQGFYGVDCSDESIFRENRAGNYGQRDANLRKTRDVSNDGFKRRRPELSGCRTQGGRDS